MILAFAVVGALASAGNATAATAATAPPSLSATLSNTRTPARLRLQIRRGGRLVYNARVRSRLCPGDCTPAAIAPGSSALRALELGPDQPAVLVGLYTGGAHCCFVDQLYLFDRARNTFRRTETGFYDDDPALVRLGSGYALRGVDARLADAYFTDFAHAGAPFSELALTQHGTRDISRRFVRQIAADAARWWSAYRRNPGNGVGFIAAWAADEDRLGREQIVATMLAAQARAGRLRSSLPGAGHSGRSFVTALQKLLRSLGYTNR